MGCAFLCTGDVINLRKELRGRRDEAVVFLGNDIISLQALEISKSLTASDSTPSRPSVNLAALSRPKNVLPFATRVNKQMSRLATTHRSFDKMDVILNTAL